MKQLLFFILIGAGFYFGEVKKTTIQSAIPENTGSSVTTEEAKAALTFHNKIRKEVGSPPLEWSAELAAYAQEWAEYLAKKNGCRMAHRASLGKADKNYGENIFWGSGKSYTLLEASKAWYSEIDNYSYRPIRRNSKAKTGHYTQMVWNTTQKMGMGMATCSDGATIIVASYNPPGNVIGQKPY